MNRYEWQRVLATSGLQLSGKLATMSVGFIIVPFETLTAELLNHYEGKLLAKDKFAAFLFLVDLPKPEDDCMQSAIVPNESGQPNPPSLYKEIMLDIIHNTVRRQIEGFH